MRISAAVLTALLAVTTASSAQAGAAAAGKAKAEPCTACHGQNGISVSGDIPNLAGQKEKYLSGQLTAFKAGERKNSIMNAIAAQLGEEDIKNLAAFWSGLPAGAESMKSAMLDKVNKTQIAFPKDFKEFTFYRTRNLAAKNQVRKSYANAIALKAAKEGKPLPNGSMVVIEVYKAKLDANKKPVKGDDGFYVPDTLAFYTAMRTAAGWGDHIPDLYRNGDWNYAIFSADKKLKSGTNQAKCLACHKPLDSDSYVFTLKQLQEVARK